VASTRITYRDKDHGGDIKGIVRLYEARSILGAETEFGHVITLHSDNLKFGKCQIGDVIPAGDELSLKVGVAAGTRTYFI